MEEQDRQVNRPVDLARYEESMERAEQRERDEAQQQQLEPPYGLTGTPLQLDDETRQLISDSSVEAGDRTRGRTTEVAELGPTLARMEVRMDNSPGRQSVGWESAPSRQSGHFKDDSVTQRVDMDDRELVPDYSGLPQGPVSSMRAVDTEGLIPGRAPRASEGSSGSQITGMDAQVQMDAMLAHMGNMVNRMITDQLAPTLNQMMLQQARVESRLEALETASRPMSVAGEPSQERAILDADEAVRQLTAGMSAVSMQSALNPSGSVVASESHHRVGNSSIAGQVPNSMSSHESTGNPVRVDRSGLWRGWDCRGRGDCHWRCSACLVYRDRRIAIAACR